MRVFRSSFLLLLLSSAFLLTGCATTEPAPPPDAPPPDAPPAQRDAGSAPLLLVSFDGFRADYPDLYATPNLDRLAAQGTKAAYLRLAFPTKTFPNHYTIVTGLYPAHHGIISNNIYDPKYDAKFSLGNTEAVRDARWWGGEPIWVTAEKQGQTAATYFWPGSEAAIQGVRPTYWKHYDGSVPGPERVDQVLRWLDLPAAERPDVATLYFSEVDHAGHRFGPESEEVGRAVAHVDAHLGRLLGGLDARGLTDRVNLMVVSDHGMAARSPKRVIFLDDYLDMDDVRVTDLSPVLMAWPDSGKADAVFEALKGAHPELDVYRKENLPARLHFSGSRRIPPLIGIASEGWSISTRGYFEEHRERFAGGTHGYLPSLESMRGILYTRGPAFRTGAQTAPVEAVDLYALMCRLLDLTPAPNDGSEEAIRTLLKRKRLREEMQP